MYLPSIHAALHPYYPERLGYRRLLGITDPTLCRLLKWTDSYSLLSGRSRVTLYREARRVVQNGVPGDFVEIGVHRGGSAAMLAFAIADERDRTLHLFDRWGDLPEPTRKDGRQQKEYSRANIPDKLADLVERPPRRDTERLLRDLQFERVRFYQGWLTDTLPEYDGDAIAFASIDCDYYESVRDALNFLDHRLSPGATIVIDDYTAWEGAKTATDEWLARAQYSVRRFLMPTGPLVLRIFER